MGKTKLGLARVIRGGIIVSLLVILAVILGYFITRSRRGLQIPVKTEKISQNKIEQKEHVEHFEFKGEKGSLRIQADKHYVDDENWNHLKGNVEIVLLKKRQGEDVFLYGDEVIYDSEWNRFQLSGKVKIRFKDLEIESTVLNYNSKTESFWSYRGVKFISQKLRGSAKKITYWVNEEKIKLEDKVHLQIKPNLDTLFPFIAKGRKFEYNQKERWGAMEGKLQLYHGESRGTADYLRFDMFPDTENIKTVFLKGGVKASLINEDKENAFSQNQTPFFAQCEKREIRAQEIKLEAFQNLSDIQAVEARGMCSFKFFSSQGGFTQFQGEDIKFVFGRNGKIEKFHAVKNARMIDQEEGPEKQRLVEGYTMILKGNSDILHVFGNEQEKARATSLNSEISAGEIAVFFNNKNLKAKEEVKITLKSQDEQEKSIGFFLNEEPIFIVAQEMRYSEETRRFLFIRDIKIWQEKKALHADGILLNEETGGILCLGGVKSIFPHKPDEEKPEEKIEISARNMSFTPEENLIFYKEESSLKVKDFHLQARKVSVYLKESAGEVQKIIAEGEVVIIQKESEGRGEEARYNPENETVILVGNPVLIDKNKGMTKGDKLTFYIADGRIVVENKEKERSETVIKS